MEQVDWISMTYCQWCEKSVDILLDRRMKKTLPKRTPSPEPCEECKKKAILLYDKNTKKFIGYAKKETFMTPEAIKQYEGTPVKALVTIEGDNIKFYNEE